MNVTIKPLPLSSDEWASGPYHDLVLHACKPLRHVRSVFDILRVREYVLPDISTMDDQSAYCRVPVLESDQEIVLSCRFVVIDNDSRTDFVMSMPAAQVSGADVLYSRSVGIRHDAGRNIVRTMMRLARLAHSEMLVPVARIEREDARISPSSSVPGIWMYRSVAASLGVSAQAHGKDDALLPWDALLPLDL